MDFGSYLPYTGAHANGADIVRFAKTAEEFGFGFLRMGEHLLYPVRAQTPYPYTADGSRRVDPTSKQLEMFTTFAFLAGQTERIRFQTGVLLVPLREPFATAKSIATLDYLSGGRFTAEVGIGWNRDEFALLGVPFEQRGKVTDAKLGLLKALLSGSTPYTADGYDVPQLNVQPLPAQQPYPVYVGCGDNRAALRRVARYASGWTPIGLSVEQFERARGVLIELLEAEGREVAELAVQWSVEPDGETLDENRLLRDVERAHSLGVTAIIVDMGAVRSVPIDALLARAEQVADAVIRRFGDEITLTGGASDARAAGSIR